MEQNTYIELISLLREQNASIAGLAINLDLVKSDVEQVKRILYGINGSDGLRTELALLNRDVKEIATKIEQPNVAIVNLKNEIKTVKDAWNSFHKKHDSSNKNKIAIAAIILSTLMSAVAIAASFLSN